MKKITLAKWVMVFLLFLLFFLMFPIMYGMNQSQHLKQAFQASVKQSAQKKKDTLKEISCALSDDNHDVNACDVISEQHTKDSYHIVLQELMRESTRQ